IKNDQPELSPRPFDANRDGLVIGEGAATLVLESLDHAQARGATIIAEVIGYHCNSDGQHITQPNVTTMKIAMAKALEDANIDASVVGYVNAHGTATEKGDIAESHATNAVFGSGTPVSSLKSYLGHTLGACGAIEAVCSVEMMNSHWFSPTLNLDQPDPECAELDYIVGEGRKIKTDHVVSNNFAFGGINTSLVFKRWQEA
ncbi:MAG: beta-ketoacyl-ACP synthase, partial [Methylococcales bacterium]|nr:beta-ketoacyl-ACP synthase [Methylococcales bacterium]